MKTINKFAESTNTVLYGNIYLDPNGPATSDNQQAILESFGDDYQRIYDALANGDITVTEEMTNDQFHDACASWLAGHGTVEGLQIQIDRSGIGAAWRDIAAHEIPATVREEIAAEIIDGNDDVENYVASNGQHYRW